VRIAHPQGRICKLQGRVLVAQTLESPGAVMLKRRSNFALDSLNGIRGNGAAPKIEHWPCQALTVQSLLKGFEAYCYEIRCSRFEAGLFLLILGIEGKTRPQP